MAEPAGCSAQQRLAQWQAQGGPIDPVRLRFLQALASRCDSQHGAVQQLLRTRLEDWLIHSAAAPAAPAEEAPAVGQDLGRPLRELLDHIARHAHEAAPAGPTPTPPPASATSPAKPVGTAPTAAPAELKALRYFRSTWTRLAVDQRLHQTQARVPGQAGPLNSQHLVHRALTLMRDVSPDYLSRFVAYVDTLLWLDQATGGGLADRKDGGRRSR